MQHKLLDSMHPDEEDAATFAMCTFPVLSQNSQTTTCPTGEEQLAEISRVNIEKGRKAFFAAGAIETYQNPHGARSINMTCIMLYGSENWVLTDQLLSNLEAFQADMGKQMLKLSRYHANIIPHLVLKLPSVKLQKKTAISGTTHRSDESTLGPTTFCHSKVLMMSVRCSSVNS